MLQRGKLIIAGLLIGILSTGLLALVISSPRGEPVNLRPPPTAGPLRVHVSGAVANPGVYTLPQDAIVLHAIEAAGGAEDNSLLSSINLAASLRDGQQIFVPTVQLASEPALELPSSHSAPTPSGTAIGLININLATTPELELLPGIGPSLAQKIVAYRDDHGAFTSVEELANVSGIGPAKLDAIRNLIRIK